MNSQQPSSRRYRAVTTRSRLSGLVTLAVIVLAIGWGGHELWQSKIRSDRAWLEKMDLENFNDTQMAVWRWCWSISGKLQMTGEEIGDAMTHDEKSLAFSAYTPRTCKYLESQRSQTRRAKTQVLRQEQNDPIQQRYLRS